MCRSRFRGFSQADVRFHRRPLTNVPERVRWLRLGRGADQYHRQFLDQIRVLRAVTDCCRAQLSLPPSRARLPESIYLRRRQPESVSEQYRADLWLC